MAKKSPPPRNWASPRDDGPMPGRDVSDKQAELNRLKLEAIITQARTAVRLGPHGERLGTVERRKI